MQIAHETKYTFWSKHACIIQAPPKVVLLGILLFLTTNMETYHLKIYTIITKLYLSSSAKFCCNAMYRKLTKLCSIKRDNPTVLASSRLGWRDGLLTQL